jgi:hypothetical protein
MLALTPAGNALGVSGNWEGYTQLPSIKGTVAGTVNCSGSSPVMTGTIPRITLTGSGVAYDLAGTLSATFVPSPAPPRLANGTWTVTASDGSGCTGKGTWSATK